MLCAFMCWYSTLPMIGIGCGIDTDHFARSGVIGNGARPKWGMFASMATLETAMLGGVVDEPMMMSAFDSVTKRRAFVVAVVGSPASSSTMTLSGTPPISLATNSSEFRSGIPSAAAGPVVVIVMPMTISLPWASAAPGSASIAATAADSKYLFIHFLPVNFVLFNQVSKAVSAPSLGGVARGVSLQISLSVSPSRQPFTNLSMISCGTAADLSLPASAG